MPNPWLLRRRGAQDRKEANASHRCSKEEWMRNSVMVAVGCMRDERIPLNGPKHTSFDRNRTAYPHFDMLKVLRSFRTAYNSMGTFRSARAYTCGSDSAVTGAFSSHCVARARGGSLES
ncbi:hypothetical protein D3C75_589040 [compost metagenome]